MKNFELKTARNSLYAVKWTIQNSKGTILIFHGLGEYAERYDTTARFYNNAGYDVYAFDLLGHGKSEGERGDIGDRLYIYHAIDCLILDVMEKNRTKPIYLHGHSLGGNICLSYRTRRQNPLVKAYILSSPWITLANNPNVLKVGLAKILSQFSPIIGDEKANTFIKNLQDGEVAEDYVRDNLIHASITPKTALDTISEGNHILKTAKEISSPVIVFHGDKDTVCSYEHTCEFIKKTKGRNMLITLNDVGHENMHLPIYFFTLEKVIKFIEEI